MDAVRWPLILFNHTVAFGEGRHQTGQVVGDVVITRKDPAFAGIPLLLVQPLSASGEPTGRVLVAVDSVGADDMIEKITGGWTDFDAVVATLVLCTVPDPAAAVRETREEVNLEVKIDRLLNVYSYEDSAVVIIAFGALLLTGYMVTERMVGI